MVIMMAAFLRGLNIPSMAFLCELHVALHDAQFVFENIVIRLKPHIKKIAKDKLAIKTIC